MIQHTSHWSFSALMMYERCPMQFKLKYIDRLPEPPRPPDNPLERGNRIHKNLEKYVGCEIDIDELTTEPKAIAKFQQPLDHLRYLYQNEMVTLEQDWLFMEDWSETDRFDKAKRTWVKLDFSVLDEANGHIVVSDYKTGKSTYKAIEHIQQTQFYAGPAVMKYPWVKKITSEVWYLDEGWVRSVEYTAEQALMYLGRFDARAARIYDDRFFRPNPSVMTCKYCPYGIKNGTGACPVAV